jgi:hypothetical protein
MCLNIFRCCERNFAGTWHEREKSGVVGVQEAMQKSQYPKNGGYCAVGDGVAEGCFDWFSPGFGRLIFFN